MDGQARGRRHAPGRGPGRSQARAGWGGEVARGPSAARRPPSRHIPPLLCVARDIMLAELDTSLGRPRAALRLLQKYRRDEFAVMTAMPRAHAHLALGDRRAAQDCVRNVLANPSALTGRYMLVEALLCDAQIAQLDGEPGRALEVVIRALEVARGEIVLPF